MDSLPVKVVPQEIGEKKRASHLSSAFLNGARGNCEIMRWPALIAIVPNEWGCSPNTISIPYFRAIPLTFKKKQQQPFEIE